MPTFGPTPPNSYGYVIFDPIYDGEELSRGDYDSVNDIAIEYLLREFEGHTKNIISHREAMAYYKHALGVQGIKCHNGQIEDAYTIAYGHGCEYEWETE